MPRGLCSVASCPGTPTPPFSIPSLCALQHQLAVDAGSGGGAIPDRIAAHLLVSPSPLQAPGGPGCVICRSVFPERSVAQGPG